MGLLLRAAAPAAVALLALVAVGCDKASPVAPTGTVLTVSANPLTIPANGTSTITAVGRKPNGLPITPGTLVRFSTTLGTIDDAVAADDSGVARATLRGDGRAGKAKVKASTGSLEAIEIEIDIGSPGASISILATPSNISELGGVVAVQALVRDAQGQLQPQAQVNFTAPVGHLASNGAVVLTDAAGTARDALSVTEADLRTFGANKFDLKAQVGGADGAIKEATQEITVGTPAGSITLQASPTTLAQTGGSVQLLALVRSEQGRPVQGARVNFQTEAGSLSSGGGSVFTDANGEVYESLRLSSSQAASFSKESFTVKAQTSGRDGAIKEATATIAIAKASSLTLQATPATLPDSGGSATLLAIVRNSLGQVLAGASVNFGTDIGTLASGGSVRVTDSNGEVRDTLSATATELATIPSGGSFQVRATVGSNTTATFTIRISSNKPVAAFVANPLGDNKVFFENQSTGASPLTFQWDFQNDGIVDSTEENPQFDYGSTGSVTVRLTATNEFGSDTAFKTVTVR
jgi:hypothetical protein